MTLWQWGLIALATLALLGATAALALALIKRKARTLAGYAPEIAILCERLVNDPRVSPIDKLKLRGLAWYLSLRFDLIPDFIPIIGRLDDALVVAVAIRTAFKSADPDLVRDNWPGPFSAPSSVLRRAKGRARASAAWSSVSL
ncbi:MAG: YkvA family protein [Solirubrobacteraceae bacterium]